MRVKRWWNGFKFWWICWYERRQMNWELFWDDWRYRHCKKFKERWDKEYWTYPSREGYK